MPFASSNQAAAILLGPALLSISIFAAAADDVVVVASATDPAAQIRKAGQILDYTGVELALRTSAGTTERIPAARVQNIETAWTPSHLSARSHRDQGEWDEAIADFQQAKREESRPWALRQIAAELSAARLDAGRTAEAVGEFLPIVASDPTTPHYRLAPIPWRATAPDALLDQHAEGWLARQDREIARLLGASWLLPSERRAAAIAVLDSLTKSSDERIAGLAAIQLWRTKIVTAKPEDTRRWQAQLEKMPSEVQAAGWYVLGDVLARQGSSEEAALAYLRAPLLFPGQRGLAADALLAAAKQLEKLGRTSQAASLYGEIGRDYQHFPAAAEAQTRLAKIGGPAK